MLAAGPVRNYAVSRCICTPGTDMFNRAAKIRIPTAVMFYALTVLLSMAMLSVLRVNRGNFYFGVATTLLAHAAVYLLAGGRAPRWAILFLLALLVPWFPPEALVPIEHGALYWGILVGLISYTLTYGAQYLLRLRADADADAGKDARRKKLDRHTSELFELVRVTNFSQALREVRKLLEEHERRQGQAGSAEEAEQVSRTARLQEMLQKTQSELKQLRRQLDNANQPHQTERRLMQNRLDQAHRKIEETSAAKVRAEQRAQSVQEFQLKFAELTQRMGALRSESLHKDGLAKDLAASLCIAEQARDVAQSECQRLASEITSLRAQVQEASTARTLAVADRDSLERTVNELKAQVQTATECNQELHAKLEQSEQARTAVHTDVQCLVHEVERLRSQLQTQPDELRKAQARIKSLETENKQAENERDALRRKVSEQSREFGQAGRKKGTLEQDNSKTKRELERARERIAHLEEILNFHQQTVEQLTPEIDRLDSIISRYESTYGPLAGE